MQTTLTSTRSYGAYGETRIAGGSARSAYAGEVGEADLPWYLLGNRFYIPSLRQFVSPDKASPFDAGGLNRYAYCGGDPINRIDPTGGSFWDYLGAALGIVGAAIGVAATGGALLGVLGAAAAGSLTASLSTTTMVAMTTATVLEAVSIVAEVGSIASLAANDQRAAGIFGWVALGAGVAGALNSAASKIAAKATRLRHVADSPMGTRRGATVHRGNGTIVTYSRGKGAYQRHVQVFTGSDVVPQGVLQRRHTRSGAEYLQAEWKAVPTDYGGTHHVNDSGIFPNEADDFLHHLIANDDGGHITLMMGAHGAANGDNWISEFRQMAEPLLADIGRDYIDAARARYPHLAHRLHFLDVTSLAKSQFRNLAYEGGHFIHGWCYSGADKLTMKALNVVLSSSYSLH